MKEYIATMTDLKKTTVAWEVAQMKPVKKGKKAPTRPTVRRMSVANGGLEKVDKIETLTTK
jgi:hypothetical protein